MQIVGVIEAFGGKFGVQEVIACSVRVVNSFRVNVQTCGDDDELIHQRHNIHNKFSFMQSFKMDSSAYHVMFLPFVGVAEARLVMIMDSSSGNLTRWIFLYPRNIKNLISAANVLKKILKKWKIFSRLATECP